jgi:hypothetical protein
MKRPPIAENVALTFADYFKLNVDVDEVLPYFGYSFEARVVDLPATTRQLTGVEELKTRLTRALPHVSLTSGTARREFLIAPILMDLIQYTGGRIKVEYPLEINPQLQGNLDYLLQVENHLVAIEAKNGDLTRGFTQLAVELIALDHWVEGNLPLLYGAVSVGDIWRFGILDRTAKRVTQDLNLFRVPADLEILLRILVGILVG